MRCTQIVGEAASAGAPLNTYTCGAWPTLSCAALLALQRNGNDLTYTAQITLADALCGTTLRLQHLDGSTVEVELRDVLTPNSIKVVK